jgi:hypothetical protein
MIDAMKKGIEALEALELNDFSGYEISKHRSDIVDEALAALRQAIEQAKKEATLQEMADIGQEIEQEPFAWVKQDVCEGQFMPSTMQPRKIWWECENNIGFPIYTAPQKYCPLENNAAYEKGFVEGMAKQMHSSVDRAVNAQPKREWVGLTDNEIKKVFEADWSRPNCPEWVVEFSKKIEAKLKEKNNG